MENEENEDYGMPADKTMVDKHHEMKSFRDLLDDGEHSMTIIKIKTLKAPEDIKDEESMDDDIQDNTRNDLGSKIRELLKMLGK